jgi:glutaredoxin
MSSLHCKKTVAILLMVMALTAGAGKALADDSAQRSAASVKLYFFWGNGCPHCEKEKEFLSELKGRHPSLVVESYEVWQNRTNYGFFGQMTAHAGIKSSGVPVTFIGNKVFVGFSERERTAISAAVNACHLQPCPDPIEWLDHPLVQDVQKAVDLPLIGKVDPAVVSLPMITVVLGGLDSFNPCAFFVLFFLLSLLVHARSRPRMLVIGGTFVFFSGLLYFLFMAAWLNLFLLAGNLRTITLAAGSVALAVSFINIKDFFLFGKGISLSIPDSAKLRLYERMRRLLKSASLVSALAGTVVLAIAANTYELLCTAGFPMVFTRILTLHSLPAPTYYLYLALYNIVYVIPLAAIVIMFTVTLGARKLTAWEGRKLKLLSGIMMLLLGMVLLVRPAALSNIFAAAVMLAAALIMSWGIISFIGRTGASEA